MNKESSLIIDILASTRIEDFELDNSNWITIHLNRDGDKITVLFKDFSWFIGGCVGVYSVNSYNFLDLCLSRKQKKLLRNLYRRTFNFHKSARDYLNNLDSKQRIETLSKFVSS